MKAGEDVELLLEDGGGTQITFLSWVDRNVFVALFSLLLAELFCAFTVLTQLLLKVKDLGVVLVKAIAEMLLHVLDFGVLGEQRKQVIYLKDTVVKNL